jgi:transposase
VSKARLVITAVIIEGRSQSEVSREYGVSQPWISRLVARYRTEGEAAFEPRSRRPDSSPARLAQSSIDLIIELREKLSGEGLDNGPHTIAWHLQHHHRVIVSAATISRHLHAAGLVLPAPASGPRRPTFASPPTYPTSAGRPTSPTGGRPTGLTWRSCVGSTTTLATPYPSRPIAASPDQWSSHHSVKPLNCMTFRSQHSPTTAWSSPRASPAAKPDATDLSRNCIAKESCRSTPHPTIRPPAARCVPPNPQKHLITLPRATTLTEQQNQIDDFVEEYNYRPHCSLPHRATPATTYTARSKARPGELRDAHRRVRTDRVDAAAPSPCASPDACTTSASAEPTPEPTF